MIIGHGRFLFDGAAIELGLIPIENVSPAFGRLKYYDGAAWQLAKLRDYNGSSFEKKELYLWDGTKWVYIHSSGF